MKNIFYSLFWFLSFLFYTYVFAWNAGSDKIENWILDWVWRDTVVSNTTWKEWIVKLFAYTKTTIFDILALIVIGTFLFIGYKILMARWKPEEFKKAFMMLIYAVLGLLFVSLSWVIVVFISGLKI